MRATLLSLALLCPSVAPAAPAVDQATGPAARELHCGGLFDARSGRLLGPHTIRVADGRIQAVAAGIPASPAGDAVDLRGHACMPGWTDLHVYLEDQSSPQSYSEGFRLDPVDYAYRSVGYADPEPGAAIAAAASP